MNNISIKRLYKCLELLINKKFDIKSRIQLETTRTEDLDDNINDFLYVLLVYTTGNMGNNDIKISSINEDEKDN